jgi:hypothetical protein
MNNQEAKLILQAYRPGGQDALDPLFAEALEQARRDPELQKWFTEEIALDARIQASLQIAVPIPPGLKSNLLALGKTVRPVPWWFQPLKLTAAAAVLLVLGLAVFFLLPRKPAQLVSFRETMARYSMQQRGHIVFETRDMAKIQQWFQGRGMEPNFELPAGPLGGYAEGCRIVDWHDRKAMMICFVLGDGEHMDLFVMDRAGLPGYRESAAPDFADTSGLTTATWAKGDKVYLLTGDSKKLLQKLFQPT